MTPINPPQLKCLNTIVGKLGMSKETKQMMVSAFSGGRATSSKDLYLDEATAIIKHLKSLDNDEPKAEKMRKKMISMAHEIGWETKPRRADMKRLDDWCKKFGYLHKSLDNYTYKELPKLVSQFESGPYKYYFSKI